MLIINCFITHWRPPNSISSACLCAGAASVSPIPPRPARLACDLFELLEDIHGWTGAVWEYGDPLAGRGGGGVGWCPQLFRDFEGQGLKGD